MIQTNPTYEPWPTRYFLGLDLGKSADYTALTVIERNGSAQDGALLVRHLQRWPLMTSYTKIVTDLCAMLKASVFVGQTVPTSGPDWQVDAIINQLEKEQRTAPLPILAIDYGGVGSAVYDLFAQAKPRARLHPILITAGRATTRESGVWHVAKIELVSVAQSCLQTDRLRVAQALPEAAILQTELRNFEMRITDSANAVFNAREGMHDDLVLAVAMGAWAATSPVVNQEFAQGVYFR